LSLETKAITVACLGSSSTAGKGQAFDWIGELKQRPHNKQFRFYNFGVGGDLAYNALRRVPEVLACRPVKVMVWVGPMMFLCWFRQRQGDFIEPLSDPQASRRQKDSGKQSTPSFAA